MNQLKISPTALCPASIPRYPGMIESWAMLTEPPMLTGRLCLVTTARSHDDGPSILTRVPGRIPAPILQNVHQGLMWQPPHAQADQPTAHCLLSIPAGWSHASTFAFSAPVQLFKVGSREQGNPYQGILPNEGCTVPCGCSTHIMNRFSDMSLSG